MHKYGVQSKKKQGFLDQIFRYTSPNIFVQRLVYSILTIQSFIGQFKVFIHFDAPRLFPYFRCMLERMGMISYQTSFLILEIATKPLICIQVLYCCRSNTVCGTQNGRLQDTGKITMAIPWVKIENQGNFESIFLHV